MGRAQRPRHTSFIVAARDASRAGLACFWGSVCARSVSSALLQLTGAFVWICECVLGVGGSATARVRQTCVCACLQADAPLSARARGGSITDQLQSAGQQTRFFFFVVFCCKMTAFPHSEHARFTTRPVMNEAPCALMCPRSSGEEACARAGKILHTQRDKPHNKPQMSERRTAQARARYDVSRSTLSEALV